MTQFIVPTLDSTSLPMPSTENKSRYSVGTTLFTPGGVPRTQTQYSGYIVTMTWERLTNADRNTLYNAIIAAANTPVTLTLTDGTQLPHVIPQSFDAYSEEKFELLIADKVQWQVSMAWRQTP